MTRKSKIPYFFFAFFAVVVSVNIFYIYISQKTWRGVATTDSYQKGLRYNETLKLAKEQEKLGWKMTVKFLASAPKSGEVVVVLLGKNLAPISDAKILLQLKRPTQEGMDFTENLQFSNGAYRAKIIFPLKGQWDFHLTATRNEDVLQEVKRYVIQ